MTKRSDYAERCYEALADDRTASVLDVSDATGLTYAQAYAALHDLEREGRVRKLKGDECGHWLTPFDETIPRWFVPHASAIAFRRCVTKEEVEVLEYLYRSPAHDRG